MDVKLTYMGKQEWPGHDAIRLWNVEAPVLPGFDYSLGRPTLALESLRKYGLVK